MSKFYYFALALALCANLLFADRVVTDQLGRDVTLPDEVKRIVVLQHQSLNALNKLNALDKVIGVQESREKSLGKNKKAKTVQQIFIYCPSAAIVILANQLAYCKFFFNLANLPLTLTLSFSPTLISQIAYTRCLFFFTLLD